jgi:hypothetical protein
MVASIAIFPTSGNITSVGTACRVSVSGADTNDASTFNADHHPAADPYSYFLRFRLAGVDDKRSYVFNVSADGTHTFNNFIFDAAGTWTVTLRNAATDAQVATASVTVS